MCLFFFSSSSERSKVWIKFQSGRRIATQQSDSLWSLWRQQQRHTKGVRLPWAVTSSSRGWSWWCCRQHCPNGQREGLRNPKHQRPSAAKSQNLFFGLLRLALLCTPIDIPIRRTLKLRYRWCICYRVVVRENMNVWCWRCRVANWQ